jgi:hypothetical protein
MAKDFGFAWILNLNNAYSRLGVILRTRNGPLFNIQLSTLPGQTVSFFQAPKFMRGTMPRPEAWAICELSAYISQMVLLP